MAHEFPEYMRPEEAAAYLGIAEDDARYLPIPWALGPDGDIWYARRDVEALEAQAWRYEGEDADDAGCWDR